MLAGRNVGKYTVAAVAGTALIAGVTSFFMYRSYEEARLLVRSRYLDQQALTTRQTARAIEESFRILERELEHLAAVEAVRRAEPAGARAAMERAFAFVRDWSVNDISRADARGVIRDTVRSPELVGRDFAFREYFKALRERGPGPAYEFITFQGVRRGQKGIIVARSILDERGAFVGPLVFVVEVSDLLARHLTALPEGTRGWVADGRGLVLYHPSLAAGTPVEEAQAGDPAFAAFLARLRAASASRVEYRAGAGPDKTLATGETITVAGERLTVVLEAPEGLVEQSLRDFKTDTILGAAAALGALLTSLAAIVLLVNRGSRKLERESAERASAEQRSRESEERFSTLIEYSPMAMALVDGEDHVLYVNRRFSELFGYTHEAVATAELWFRAAYPDEAYRAQQLERWRGFKARRGAVRRRVQPSVHQVTGRDGAVHQMELHGALIGDKYLVMFNDVTERTRLEHQLRHAQKMDSFGRLAGGVAHDFNNILTAILGHAELLGARLEPASPLRPSVDTIVRSATSAARLTSSLLAFSRRQVLHRRFVDVGEAVRNVQRMLERIVGEDIAVELSLANLEVGVVADYSQLEQVLMNLAANARDAMPRGGTIRIATAQARLDEQRAAEVGVPRPGLYVVLSFSDTGVGMDERTLERIFEPFFTTKEMGRGTGLGLAIVYGIISQHEGAIAVASSPGQGTRFDVYLAATPFPADGDEAGEAAGEPPQVCGRLLLVEDDDAVRLTVAEILRSGGCEVVDARSGEEALRLFGERGDGLEMVVLDVVMPGMSGAEVFRELRRRRPDVRVLFLSGYAEERLRDDDILAAPGVVFLAKPVSRRRLLLALREVLGETPQPPAPPDAGPAGRGA